jgi:hypothetical protein
LSTPIITKSSMVSTAVPRPSPTFTPGRGACQPPMPSWTRLTGGALGMFVA